MRRHIATGKYRRADQESYIFGVNSSAYYRQGVALQQMDRHAEALAAFAMALAQDPASQQLLQTFTEAAVKSPLEGSIGPTLHHLKMMSLDTDPYIIISIVGQELLSFRETEPAIKVLESALKIGTDDVNLKGSVLSALSSAYWKLGDIKKGLEYMREDLKIAESLQDEIGQCRAHSNLGNACYSKGLFKEAIEHHRSQLTIATTLNDRNLTTMALSSLGHDYVSIGDLNSALASHKRCALICQQLHDQLGEARELGNVGSVYVLMGDMDNASHCHHEHLRIAEEVGNNLEKSRACSNIGSLYYSLRNYDESIRYYRESQKIGEELNDFGIRCRALAGLGHSYRGQGNLQEAIDCHEKQLKLAISLGDRTYEGRARSNLGVTLHEKGQYSQAMEFHKGHLAICRELNDKDGEGRAYGNIGNAYHSIGQYERAIKYHRHGLTLASELNDKHSEASLHGNLAVAYQALELFNEALSHYQEHLKITKDLKDLHGECLAESNLGNFHSAKGDFHAAAVHYENQLSIAEKLRDRYEMSKACHNLAYAYYSTGDYSEAIEYYERNINLANELQDNNSLGTAYCNLGLAYLAMNDYSKAVQCQKGFLALSRERKNVFSICKGLSNLGEIYVRMGDFNEAIVYFKEQLRVANDNKVQALQSSSLNILGRCYRDIGNNTDASDAFLKELALRKAFNDSSGVCQCLENLGVVHAFSRNFDKAFEYYQEQLDVASRNKDHASEARAYGNLGIAKAAQGIYSDAISFFQSQIEILSKTKSGELEEGRARERIAECFLKMRDLKKALRHYEMYLELASKCNSTEDEESAYKGLCCVYKAMGNLQQALVCAEKRLVLSLDSKDRTKCDAYWQLGTVHHQMKNYEQAMSCFQNQLKVARESSNDVSEVRALGGLGEISHAQGNYKKALEYHKLELELSQKLRHPFKEANACRSLGIVYEFLGQNNEAIAYLEKSISIASKIKNDNLRLLGYSRLSKLHHLMKNYPTSTTYLQQALGMAKSEGNVTELIKCYFRLGVIFFVQGNYDSSLKSFFQATDIVEREFEIRDEVRDATLIDFGLASYQMLQRVFIASGKPLEALRVAEQGRIWENMNVATRKYGTKGRTTHVKRLTSDEILESIRKLNVSILYYSVAAGQLYIWFLTPDKGIVKFAKVPIVDGFSDADFEGADLDEVALNSSQLATDVIEQYVGKLRAGIGVGKHCSKTELRRERSFNNDMVEILDPDKVPKKKKIGLRATFIKPVTTPRSTYEFVRKQRKVTKLIPIKDPNWAEKTPLSSLYTLLIGPVSNELDSYESAAERTPELLIIIPTELLLIPFSLLRRGFEDDFLFERFQLRISSSLKLSKSEEQNKSERTSLSSENFVYSGKSSGDREEATVAAKYLKTEIFSEGNSTKEEICEKLQAAKICHFSTEIDWPSASLLLSGGDVGKTLESSPASDPETDDPDPETRLDPTPSPDIVLSPKDIEGMSLFNRLVVFGISQMNFNDDAISSEPLKALMSSFLHSGAKSVLASLWPVPTIATRQFLTSFYGSFLEGTPAAEALQISLSTMKSIPEFSHPSNWAGFMLYGTNSTLEKKKESIAQVLHVLLEMPNRDAIKVLLHLVEKSRQRIAQGKRNTMYTAEESIKAKIGNVLGWKELLKMVGFRFERAHGTLPDSVFFPTSEHTEILNRCSNTLYAFLGLTKSGLEAISKLRSSPEAANSLIPLLREVIECFADDISNIQVPLSIKIWRIAGCHEFLASLGFDLMGVGRDEVVLRSGKANLRRPLQCALQAVIDLFEAEDYSGDFMYNISGKAYSELQLRDQNNNGRAVSKNDLSQKDGGYHPVRRARSSPLQYDPSDRRNGHRNDRGQAKTEQRHEEPFLTTRKGLFSSKEMCNEEDDQGPSARKLRTRTSNTNILKSSGSFTNLRRSTNSLMSELSESSVETGGLKRYGTLSDCQSVEDLSSSTISLKSNLKETDINRTDSLKDLKASRTSLKNVRFETEDVETASNSNKMNDGKQRNERVIHQGKQNIHVKDHRRKSIKSLLIPDVLPMKDVFSSLANSVRKQDKSSSSSKSKGASLTRGSVKFKFNDESKKTDGGQAETSFSDNNNYVNRIDSKRSQSHHEMPSPKSISNKNKPTFTPNRSMMASTPVKVTARYSTTDPFYPRSLDLNSLVSSTQRLSLHSDDISMDSFDDIPDERHKRRSGLQTPTAQKSLSSSPGSLDYSQTRRSLNVDRKKDVEKRQSMMRETTKQLLAKGGLQSSLC